MMHGRINSLVVLGLVAALAGPGLWGQMTLERPKLAPGTNLRYRLSVVESLERKNFPHGLRFEIETETTLPLQEAGTDGLQGLMTYGIVSGKVSIGEETRPFTVRASPGINQPGGPEVTIRGDDIQTTSWTGLKYPLMGITRSMGRTSMSDFRPLFERLSWARSSYHHVALAVPRVPTEPLKKASRWEDPLLVARPVPGVTLHFDCSSTVKRITDERVTVVQSGEARLDQDEDQADPKALKVSLGPAGGSWTSELVLGRKDGRLVTCEGEGTMHLLVEDPKSKVTRPQALVARWSFTLDRVAR